MPVAIPIIAAAVGYAAGYVTFTALVVTVASTVIQAALAPKAKATDTSNNLTGLNRLTQVRQPISPHSIPYGHFKTSGPIVFLHSQEDIHGRSKGDLFAIHVLAATQIRAIRTIYYNDDLADQFFFQQGGTTQGISYKHLGETTQAADAQFLAQIAFWTSNHRLQGRAYIASKFTHHRDIMPAFPNVTAVIDGVDTIYDPRTAATGFTNNAALCIANYLTSTYGMNLAWAKLDEPSVIAAANVCDERVLVAAAGTTFVRTQDEFALGTGARVLDWGDGVRVSSTGTLPAPLVAGTTYYVVPSTHERIFLASSPANAMARNALSITDAGSGTHTLTYYDEARYKCNGNFTLDASKRDVLEQLLSSMAGVTVYLGGKWFIHAGAAATPTITLDEDDLRGDLQISPKRSMRDRINGVRCVFVNPDAKWQPTDARPRLNATYLAEDDGEELYDDLRLAFTTSARTAQRLMKIHLERNRRQRSVAFPAKLTAMRLTPWDGVYLAIDRLGWTAEQHRVLGWALSEDGGVDLQLQEDDSGIYTWTSSEETSDIAIPEVGVPAPQTSTVNPPVVQVAQVPGAADDDDAITTGHALAIAEGSALFFPRGAYNLESDFTFTVPVVMEHGAYFVATGSPTTVRTVTFTAGFSGSTTIHFSTNIIASGVGSNTHSEIFPQWWGALGDGVTDDSAAFQSAIDYCEAAGAVLRIIRSSNWYYCGTTGLVVNGGIKIYGDGASNLFWSDSFTGTCLAITQPYVILQDFSISKPNRASLPSANAVGIYVSKHHCTFRNVKVESSGGAGSFFGFNTGIRVDEWSHSLQGCTVVGDTYGVYSQFANAVFLVQCFISAREATSGAAVFFEGGSAHAVKGCDIEGPSKYGVRITDGGTVDSGHGCIDISGNYFESHDIEISILGSVSPGKQVRGVTIMGNFLSDGGSGGDFGIQADYCDGLIIGGNGIFNHAINSISIGANVDNFMLQPNHMSSTVGGWIDLAINASASGFRFDNQALTLESADLAGNGIKNSNATGFMLIQGGNDRLKGAGVQLMAQSHGSLPRRGRLFSSADGVTINNVVQWERTAGGEPALGLYDTAPVVQHSSTGTVTGFTANSGGSPTPLGVLNTSTFTGGVGTKAYTIGDLVKMLKVRGDIASS